MELYFILLHPTLDAHDCSKSVIIAVNINLEQVKGSIFNHIPAVSTKTDKSRHLRVIKIQEPTISKIATIPCQVAIEAAT